VSAARDTHAPAGPRPRSHARAARDASPGAHWQGSELVELFLENREALLPLIDVQEEVVRRLFDLHRHELTRFLDIGAGNGAISELLLDAASGREAVLVDFSEPMLARAESRLAGRGRWQLVRGDLSAPSWREALPAGRFSGAVSSLAIHHLPAERKRALYAEVFEILEPRAMFVNMDYTEISGPLSGLWDERILDNQVRIEHTHGGARSREEIAREIASDDDDDRPDTVDEQLQWLREAGFAEVEIHFKWAEAAIFGGVKPE
jgi:tRNA (cmo5U34)-methyltransferase